MKQNYENYHKAYYHKNKERIKERTREYRRNYNKLYYLENREKILAKRLKDKETRMSYTESSV